jgi:hypothetical protein
MVAKSLLSLMPLMSKPMRGSRLVPRPRDPTVGPTTPPLGELGDPLIDPTVVRTPLVASIA